MQKRTGSFYATKSYVIVCGHRYDTTFYLCGKVKFPYLALEISGFHFTAQNRPALVGKAALPAVQTYFLTQEQSGFLILFP